MTRGFWIPLTVVGVGLAAAPAFAQGTAMSQQDATQVANGIETKWMTNYNAGSAAGVGAMFAPDGTWAATTGVLSGTQAITDAVAARLKAGWPKLTTTVLQAHAVGDVAWLLGEYTYAGAGPNSGKQQTGNFAKVLTRDGADWRIRLLIGNAAPPKT
jgi:ketosteroid isomerase-like protein